MKLYFLLFALFLFVCVTSAKRTRWHELDETYTFERYKQEFNKVYSSKEEENKRRQFFQKKLAKIIKHNKDKTKTWKEGVNHFTDIFPEETEAMRGYDKGIASQFKNRKEGYNVPQSVLKPGAYPPSVDWRTKNIFTAVKDQGQCGSCWTFATTEGVEAYTALKFGSDVLMDYSEQQILDCTPNPNECGGTGGCQGGTAELALARLIELGGMTTEWLYPYRSYFGKNFPCTLNSTKEPPYTVISNYTKLPTNNYDALMNTIANIGPVMISVQANTWQNYESGVYDGCPANDIDIDHLVLLVGYGIDAATNMPYWLIRNSWNVNWGMDGYMKLRRHTTSHPCGTDYHPQDGTGCKNGPSQVTACGSCGILYDTSYPHISKLN